MSQQVYLSPPDVTDAESQAVQRAMASGWIAPLGPEVDAFEAELASYAGREHCVALASGTAALHLALLSLGIGPGDKVLTASMTFAATANAITYTGATPVFVDCDETGNIDVALLSSALEELAAEGTPAAAIVPVDLLGKVADQESIAGLAAERGIPVISDAAESFGARRSGRSSAAFGEAAAVSFNGNKIMTTSGGGALLTDDGGLARHVRYLATQARQPVVHYEHTDIGYNYRLSNVLAALGRAQLERLDGMIGRRRSHRIFYGQVVADLAGVTLFGEPSGLDDDHTHDNWWLTSLLIDPEVAGFSRDDLMAALRELDIEARPLWKPLHLQPVFSGHRSFVTGVAELLFTTGISLPSGSVLADDDRSRVADTILGLTRR